MVKPELGTKRLCAGCGAKFYDLSKNPIVCPKCETVFEPVVAVSRARPDQGARAAAKEPEVVTPETADAEFVSLEDADAEAVGGKKAVAAVPEGEDDIEIDEALDDDDDDTFIEESEEGDADVTDIIGDVETEEET
ncbi:MAG TPA: TIGR02300 family protein [Xanthobacteraceae bacterium]